MNNGCGSEKAPALQTLVRDAKEGEFNYIDSLRKREGSALGFIPRAVYESILERRALAGRERWRYMRLLVTEDNGDLTGFCLTTFAGSIAHILQIVVQQDARRWARALLMADLVEADANHAGKVAITCRVAMDLESNLFWRAIGYTPIRQVVSTWLNQRESKSRRPLWVYEKPIRGLFDVCGG